MVNPSAETDFVGDFNQSNFYNANIPGEARFIGVISEVKPIIYNYTSLPSYNTSRSPPGMIMRDVDLDRMIRSPDKKHPGRSRGYISKLD